MSTHSKAGRRDALRRYPALGFLGVAALLAVALPSALTVPNAGPPTLAEFAPVPGQGQGAGGDLGRLGAGSSGDLGFGPEGPQQPGPGGDPGQPSAELKRCVGDPPRQTEDPLSPPCVAFFQGENFGATAPGVSEDEVRVLVYYEFVNQCSTSRGCDRGPGPGTIIDIADPGEHGEFVWIRMLRAYQRYFNDRFQTYGRFVHLYAQVASTDDSPASRRAQAAEAIEQVDPFAVIAFAGENAEAYLLRAASEGIMAFPGSDGFSAIGQPASFYRRFPGKVWSYRPSLEHWASIFSSYVCEKVIPHRVSFSGNAGDMGNERRLGLLWGVHEKRPDLKKFAAAVRDRIEGCGGVLELEDTFATEQSIGQPDPNATQAMARFKQEGITTIIWAGGLSQNVTRAAASIDYRPEIVLAGDGLVDGTAQGQLFQEQSVWQHARAVTQYTYNPPPHERVCVQAALEANRDENMSDVDRFGCRWYPDLRQLFTGIQVAGPRLTAETMDRGFHAIPAVASSDPTVPACFYRPADYSCMKDAVAEWWDPSGVNRNETVGCWRMMEGGKRYLANKWPKGDVEAQRSAQDPCNLQNFHPAG